MKSPPREAEEYKLHPGSWDFFGFFFWRSWLLCETDLHGCPHVVLTPSAITMNEGLCGV